jgi:hypothetical protein
MFTRNLERILTMTIGSATSAAYVYPPTNQQNPFQQSFQSLIQAIQSGNLSGAQQAYAALTQSAPAQGANGASNGQNNPFQQGLAAIGSALQSGNISGAQSALQSLQQTMKAHHGHHHSSGMGPQNSNSQTSSQSSATIAALSGVTNSILNISA